MRIGKEMQFFGARANLAKCLLYAINGGVDEKTRRAGRARNTVRVTGEYLDYDDVMAKYRDMMDWLAGVYVNIAEHHPLYARQVLLRDACRWPCIDTACAAAWFATGIAGLSVVADSLSAIKYAKVKVHPRRARAWSPTYEIEGDFPKYGNDDDRVDEIAVERGAKPS